MRFLLSLWDVGILKFLDWFPRYMGSHRGPVLYVSSLYVRLQPQLISWRKSAAERLLRRVCLGTPDGLLGRVFSVLKPQDEVFWDAVRLMPADQPDSLAPMFVHVVRCGALDERMRHKALHLAIHRAGRPERAVRNYAGTPIATAAWEVLPAARRLRLAKRIFLLPETESSLRSALGYLVENASLMTDVEREQIYSAFVDRIPQRRYPVLQFETCSTMLQLFPRRPKIVMAALRQALIEDLAIDINAGIVLVMQLLKLGDQVFADAVGELALNGFWEDELQRSHRTPDATIQRERLFSRLSALSSVAATSKREPDSSTKLLRRLALRVVEHLPEWYIHEAPDELKRTRREQTTGEHAIERAPRH